MKFKDTPETYICQLGKPENRAVLENYKARRVKGGVELANYYKDVISMLINTPAWGVSGVNKMVNELTTKVRATLNKEKKGKTSAYAHAAKLLRDINYFSNEEAEPKYKGRYKLKPILTEAEFKQLLAL